MKKLIRRQFVCICLVITGCVNASSQGIGIGTNNPHASAVLDVQHASKGMLIPRMTTTAINTISNPAKGLLVYDTVVHQLKVNMGTQSAPNWQSITARSSWSLTGNSGLSAATNFLGTTDNRPLRFRVNNIMAGEMHPVTGNISFGLHAAASAATGYSNIAIGSAALRESSSINNTVAIGDSALYHVTTGDGSNPIFGTLNTAVGSKALYSNTTGYWNTSFGNSALYSNTVGWGNAAVGSMALGANTIGNQNTALGEDALRLNTTSSLNTAIGAASLYANIGYGNTAVGSNVLSNNIDGNFNTAIGGYALQSSTNSSYNTAIGYAAGWAQNMGWNNTFVGANASSSVAGIYNGIAIGQNAACTGNNMARIGNLETVSIGGIVAWTNLSDGRFKRNIREEVKGLDFIMKLRPVNYQMDITTLNKKLNVKNDGDNRAKKAVAEQEAIVYTGFIAQEVEQAARQAGYEFSGVDKPKNENDVYGLRYSAFVVPLVKAIQEQQQMIEALKKRVEELERK